MDIEKERIINAIYSSGCLKFGEFTLSSGRKSNVYIDLRLLYSFPRNFKIIVNSLVKLMNKREVDYICGIPTGGLPLASVVAYLLDKPFIYVRKKEKGHGRMRRIEGNMGRCGKVLIVDDVATTGGSIRDAATALRENDCDVREAIVVVDRVEGARENLLKIGLNLISLVTLSDILEWCRMYGKSEE